MRPRLITAENGVVGRSRYAVRACFNEAAAHHRGEPEGHKAQPRRAATASMRPRLITAENIYQKAAIVKAHVASMRPRLITAENGHRPVGRQLRGAASMRPRLITAENGGPASHNTHL